MAPVSPAPSGPLLILSVGAITIFGGLAGMLAGHRAFEVAPSGVLFMVVPLFVIFGVFILPITLGVLFLIRRKNLRPWLRTLLVSAPALVFALPYLGGGLVNPADPSEVFAKRMNHPLPANATDLRSWYFHGIGESHYMFSIQATPDATDDLLQSAASEVVEHHPMLDPELGVHFELPINDVSVPKGWPKPKTWDGLKLYRSGQIKDYCYIITDASKTRVFVMVGDT
jgi:hypothetical protein